LKSHLAQILTLAFFVLLTNNSFAQNRFGNIECDSFQVTVNESEAIVFQGEKTAVYNRAKQEFLIEFTKSSIIFFPVDNYYLVADKEQLMFYNFYCSDTLAPCIMNYQADSSIFFNTTNNGKITMSKDRFDYGVFPNFHLETEWTLFRINERHPNSAIRNKRETQPFKSVGAERLNDSLLVVINYKADYNDPTAWPLKSLQYPSDDSVFYEQETGFYYAVYPGPIPGYEYSGIYNLNGKNWLVQPTKLIEYYSSQGVLFGDAFRYSNYGIDSMNYSFVDLEGNYLFKELGSFDLFYSVDVSKIITNAGTVWSFPQFTSDDTNIGRHFNIVKEGKMALLNPEHSFHPITKFKDFIYYNVDYGYYFWLENDSIYAEINGLEYCVSQANGIMEIHPAENWESFNYTITLIENTDTLKRKIATREIGYERYYPPLKVRLEIINGDLIINDTKDNKPADETRWTSFLADNRKNYFQESIDASSIWRKTESGWIKKTQNYKSIEKIDFGFIVVQQTFYRKIGYHTGRIFSPETFSFLDNNFSPMTFNGISEFTAVSIKENSIELTTEKGCLIIDHQGKLIIKKV
jgi:hypothetical protein